MEKLSNQDQHTYDAMFRHPTSGNIEWHALMAMFNHIGEVIEEPNGKVKILRNGHTLTLHQRGKDVALDTIKDIREFLKLSGVPDDVPAGGSNFLLVLDFAGARVYRTEDSDAKPVHIEPYDPNGLAKHVHDTHEYARPHTTRLHHEFYERILEALKGAEAIFVFTDGAGSSEEFEHMIADLKNHPADFENRIVGQESFDLKHMTEGQILAEARKRFAGVPALVG